MQGPINDRVVPVQRWELAIAEPFTWLPQGMLDSTLQFMHHLLGSHLRAHNNADLQTGQ